MIARSAPHAAADEALETFTVRLPRWPIFGLFRRNPLLRASDRIEALVLALAVMVLLLAVPVADTVGTAVHDSRRDVYAQQHHNRHLVTAAITDDTAAQNDLANQYRHHGGPMDCRGAEHTGAVAAQSATKPGDHVAIWVDDNGALTDEPTPTTRAGADAVTAALFMWAGVTAAVVILLAGTRAVCDRIRAIEMATRHRHPGRPRRAQTQPALNRRQSSSSPYIHEYGKAHSCPHHRCPSRPPKLANRRSRIPDCG